MKTSAIYSCIISQMQAALHMLKSCIDRCPDNEWNEKRGDYPFSQVVFHALFDCDYHLCDHKKDLKEQIFHIENATIFSDYEELEERMATRVYEKAFISGYHEHCKMKVEEKINGATLEEMLEPNSDVRGNMTKMERYLNTTRHIQHHAAQLGLRLQFVTGEEMDWVSRGIE